MNKIEIIKKIGLLGIFLTFCVFFCSNDVRKTRFSYPGQEGRFGGRFDPQAEKKIETLREKIKTMPSMKTEEEAIKVLDSLFNESKDIASEIKIYQDYKNFEKYVENIIKEASKFKSEKIKLTIARLKDTLKEYDKNTNEELARLNKAAKELYSKNTDSMNDKQYNEWSNEVTKLFEKTKFFATGEYKGKEAAENEREFQTSIEEFNKLSQKASDASAKRGKPTEEKEYLKLDEALKEAQRLVGQKLDIDITKDEYEKWKKEVDFVLASFDDIFEASKKQMQVPEIFVSLSEKRIYTARNIERKEVKLGYAFLTHKIETGESSEEEQKLIQRASGLESKNLSSEKEYLEWALYVKGLLDDVKKFYRNTAVKKPGIFDVLEEKLKREDEKFKTSGKKESLEEQKLVNDASDLENNVVSLMTPGEYDSWHGAVHKLLSRVEHFYKESKNIPNIFHELYVKFADENSRRKLVTFEYKFLKLPVQQ